MFGSKRRKILVFTIGLQHKKRGTKETKGQKPQSQEELELLERIDFAFLENHSCMAWNARYAELERYREENDGRLPDHGDDPELNHWMRQQRKSLRSEYG
ncbi:unnamed protein product [Cylindrotheca closterium]|uniref:Helicase-associated domain-containing protein n=1 Tax=Cylindrotheca closterium TaxID=2856 RepID=A0AAD2G804_9STRA|nr:unnamed protein product [Cylindrotheca closterium]